MMEGMIEELKGFALEHYEEGGHWVFETYDKNDYIEAITECKGDIKKAKAYIRNHWELIEEQRLNTLF